MAENKKKWTIIDTAIVLAVAGAGVFAFNMFGAEPEKGEKTTVETLVLMSASEESLANSIKVGEKITISLSGKDTAMLKDLRIEPAQTMSYNSEEGEYINTLIEDRVDIYATLEVEVSETDYYLMVGETKLKVGSKLPFRGKGFATEGYIIDIK